ncbi:MAG: hypothetical protein ACI81L_002839 [Verrucomicrobiales bacterium]|jgi:hypothetical protein
MVHRRQVENETLIFGVHGALLGNAMTWWDHGTGSIWTQPTGQAIAGPRKGQTVDLLPSQFTSWAAWKESYPNTQALDVPAGPSSFDLTDFLIVVDFTDEARGYAVPDLRQVGVVNDTVAGIPIAVVSDPADPTRWAVYSRVVDGEIREFDMVGGELLERSTGTTYNPARGFGLDGPLSEETLDHLAAFTSFPSDFPTFWPDGTVWDIDSGR